MRENDSSSWFYVAIAACIIAYLLRQNIFLQGKTEGLSERPAVSVEQNIQMGVNSYKSQTTTDCVERPECDPLFGGGQ